MSQWSGLQRQQQQNENKDLKKVMLQLAMRKAEQENNVGVQEQVLSMISDDLTLELKQIETSIKGINSLVTQRDKVLKEKKDSETSLRNAEKQYQDYYRFAPTEITTGPDKGEWEVQRVIRPMFEDDSGIQQPGTNTYTEHLGNIKAKEKYEKQRTFWQNRINTLTDKLSAKAKKKGSFEQRLSIINTEIENKIASKKSRSEKVMEIYEDLQVEKEVMSRLLNLNAGKTGVAKQLQPTATPVDGPGNDPVGVPADPDQGQLKIGSGAVDPSQTIKKQGGVIRINPSMGKSTTSLNQGDMQRNQQLQIKDRLNNAERNFTQNPGGKNLKMLDDKELVNNILKNFLT